MTSRIMPVLVGMSLVAFGAGCSSKTTSSVLPYSTETDSYGTSNQTEPVGDTMPSTPPDQDSSTSTSSAMTHEQLAFPGVLPATETANKIVRLNTTKGDIVFELLPQEGPNAASNFVYLTKKKFYDGLTFHRVEPGFVIQGGDPLGNGRGGPGYAFEDDAVKLPYAKGIVAMANAGPDTNGSQFFIMLEDNPLPPAYSIFGRVLSGQDVVSKIQIGDVMTTVIIEDKK
jgi:peptidyl-prolyl cis-trans isomerase B (cyclophilin B)